MGIFADRRHAYCKVCGGRGRWKEWIKVKEYSRVHDKKIWKKKRMWVKCPKCAGRGF